MSYAEITDAAPLLKKMAEHADAGLPFLATEFDPATYQVETPAGLSNMPAYDEIEASNLEGGNSYDAASTCTTWQSPWASHSAGLRTTSRDTRSSCWASQRRPNGREHTIRSGACSHEHFCAGDILDRWRLRLSRFADNPDLGMGTTAKTAETLDYPSDPVHD